MPKLTWADLAKGGKALTLKQINELIKLCDAESEEWSHFKKVLLKLKKKK